MEGDTFKREVLGILQRHHPEWLVENDGDHWTISIDSKRISLENIQLYTRTLTIDQREKAILDFAETLQASADSPKVEDIPFDEARARVMPQIVAADYKNQLSGLLTRPFSPGLDVAYVLDEEKRYNLLRDPVLGAWKIDRAEIERIALLNLEKLTAGDELVAKSGPERGLYLAFEAEDSFSAARLLLPSFMARVRGALKAPSVFVGIPNRDFILAWTPNLSVRQRLADAVSRDVTIQPYPLTDDLFVSSDAGLRPASADEAQDQGR